MATLADVAQRAGVSKATASRALSNGKVSAATRERVLQIAAELHYVASPAAVSLATGRTGMLAAIVPNVDSWYTASLIRGIGHAALSHDYDLILFELGEHGEHRDRAFEHFRRRRHVDGVVSANFAVTHAEAAALAELGIPVGAIGGALPDLRTWCLDDEETGYRATRHLVEAGHTDILFAGGRPDEKLAMYIAEQARFQGHLRAMHEAGLTPRTPWPIEPRLNDAASRGRELFAAAPTPSAIVAACDEIALGLMLAARESGLEVPRDLSIIGVDDHPHSAAFGLTTIRQTPATQGHLVIDWLVQEITSPSPDRSHTALPPELVRRSSVARAPHNE